MKAEKQAARRAEIEEAAFDLVLEKGFNACSMLTVAKHVGASNETLYRWYGDKTGLFRAMVERNAAMIAEALQASATRNGPLEESLSAFGEQLLGVLLSERAVALNRAAAADADTGGVLGKALADAGRNTIAPLIKQLFERDLPEDAAEEAAEIYIALLVGDLQIRRATGAMAALPQEVIAQRAKRAAARCLELAKS